MSTTFHAAIASGAAANASTFNGPLGTLDAAIAVAHDADGTLKANAVDVAAVLASDVVETAKIKNDAVTTAKILDANVTAAKLASTVQVYVTVSAQMLKEWTEGGDYEMTSAAYDSDGVVTGGTVKWPDGAAGVFTTVTKNSTWLAIDAYTVTHATAGTVTQTAVTRDGNGQVTAKPYLTVA